MNKHVERFMIGCAASTISIVICVVLGIIKINN